jgi:4-hydroxythreonine-4-phosphate dehydrogenase
MAKLALTIGDPTGIGPEITAKLLHRMPEFPGLELTVIGSLDALAEAAELTKAKFPEDTSVTYVDIEADSPGDIAFGAIDYAVSMIKEGEAQALVTGPISKKNLQEAGYDFPGHTEILEEMAHDIFNAPDARAEMLFAYKNFRLLLLTRHIALNDVSAALSQPGAVARPLRTLIRFFRDHTPIDEPRIAMLGVNPHAGELDGDIENKFLLPVIHAVNGVGASRLDGPFPADAFFRDFDPATTVYDAVVAAYHDQGLIPFKLLAGHEAVNITIGLPFIRTSVSHGTAEDIVGKGIASEASLIAAVQMAIKFSK